MTPKRRRYRQQWDEADEMELGDVLEPEEEPDLNQLYEDGAEAYEADEYDYSDEHEAIDNGVRFKVAMGLFDTVSILIGVLAILVLVAILVTLVNWLAADIEHSVLLMQSGLQ
ncbi:MAG: hypothetical protein MRZ54_06530 [Clostridiales bacterium]|nr:hypothetical protein [Clostridiales bacterium]